MINFILGLFRIKEVTSFISNMPKEIDTMDDYKKEKEEEDNTPNPKKLKKIISNEIMFTIMYFAFIILQITSFIINDNLANVFIIVIVLGIPGLFIIKDIKDKMKEYKRIREKYR